MYDAAHTLRLYHSGLSKQAILFPPPHGCDILGKQLGAGGC